MKHAEECGASGVLLYPDPSEVYDAGSDAINAYPDSRYLPGWATRRGSLWRFGDPLTPSTPSRGIGTMFVSVLKHLVCHIYHIYLLTLPSYLFIY